MCKKVAQKRGVTAPLLFVAMMGKSHAEVSGGWHATAPPCVMQNQHGTPVVGCNISTACLSIFLFFFLALALGLLWNECVIYRGKKDKFFESCSVPPNHSTAVKIRIVIWCALIILLAAMIANTGIHL